MNECNESLDAGSKEHKIADGYKERGLTAIGLQALMLKLALHNKSDSKFFPRLVIIRFIFPIFLSISFSSLSNSILHFWSRARKGKF